MKKILEHLDLWDVKCKPPPRANSPPTDPFIIYDERSSPSADDYIINADRTTSRLSKGYPTETYIKKNPAAGALVNYTQIGLNFPFHRNN